MKTFEDTHCSNISFTPSVSYEDPPSSSTPEPEHTPANTKSKKRKQKESDLFLDEELSTTLKKVNQTTDLLFNESHHEDDGDALFCKSIIPTLKGLSPRNNRLAKIKIQQLLFDLEFE